MNKLLLSSAVALFLLAPANAQSVGEKTGVNSALSWPGCKASEDEHRSAFPSGQYRA